ncbi:MAG: hypothetical protein VYC40_00490, partial [Pseudomonadota bacterium]|nr:hypothetical protein [Pseudomonadota bacterium]
FNNVVYNNTCLTHGKDIFGTSQPSNIPLQVEKMKIEYDENPGGYEDKVKGEIQTRLMGDPQEWILQAEANAIDSKIISAMRSALEEGSTLDVVIGKLPSSEKNLIQTVIGHKAGDMARQRTCAIKALVAMNKEGGIKRMHHNDHLVSQAAYVNIAMASDGFEVHAGCKSSLDRAGGELTTRTAYEDYIRQHNEPPTRENLKRNPEKAKFLATQYMSIYQKSTAQIGAQNRFGLDATKTYERFVGSEAKYAMQLRTDKVKGSRDYVDYVKSFAESNMGDEKLLEIALAGNIEEITSVIGESEKDRDLLPLKTGVKLNDIQVAAQNAFNARKIAKDAFTFENEKKAQNPYSEVDKYYANLEKTINRMQEGKVFPNENSYDTFLSAKGYVTQGVGHAVGAAVGLAIEPITLLIATPNIFEKVHSEMLKRFGENNKNLKKAVFLVPALIVTSFVTALAFVVRPLGYLFTKLKSLLNTAVNVVGDFASSPSIKQSASIVPVKESRTSFTPIEPPSLKALTECKKPRKHQPLAIRGVLKKCKHITEERKDPMNKLKDDQQRSTNRSEIITRGEDDTFSL